MTSKYACNCIAMRRMANRVTAFYNTRLEPSGLTVSQYSLLMCISVLAPVNVSDLARPLELDRTTLVRNLKPLEAASLVYDSAERGRSKQLMLTEKGKEVLGRARVLWEEAQTAFEGLLGDERLAAFNDLKNLLDGIE